MNPPKSLQLLWGYGFVILVEIGNDCYVHETKRRIHFIRWRSKSDNMLWIYISSWYMFKYPIHLDNHNKASGDIIQL